MVASQRLKSFFVLCAFLSFPLAVCCTDDAVPAQTVSIRILTANIASYSTGFPGDKLIDAVEAAAPDIVAIQEPLTNSVDLANALELTTTKLQFSARSTEILSTYPVASAYDNAVDLQYCPGQIIRVSSIHTSYSPLNPLSYGPYAIRDDSTLTEQAIIDAQKAEHGPDIASLITTMDNTQKATPVASFIAGDFNEPSHLDWTEEASSLHLNRAVAWPSSTTLYEAGFLDGWRTIYPNPVTDPGNTWTPFPSADEVHDRIDMVYHRGDNIRVVSAEIVGEDSEHADIVVEPFPSDHRFVVVEYEISGVKCP